MTIAFKDNVTHFGQGNWHVRKTAVGGRPTYGVCSDGEGDLLSIAPDQPDGVEFGSVGLLVKSDPNKKPVPLDPHGVSCSFSDGYWGSYEADNDVTIAEPCFMPLADNGVFVLLRDPERNLQQAIENILTRYEHNACMRVNLAKGGPIDHSRYAFIKLNGLRQAWRAMIASRDATAALLNVRI